MPRRPAGLLAGGQGVRSDPGSEGFEEKYRAVIEWERSLMNRSAKDGARYEPALWGRRRYSFTHRTKVFAGGTIRKIHVRPQETCRCPGSNQVSDPISESEMGSDAPSGVGERNRSEEHTSELQSL